MSRHRLKNILKPDDRQLLSGVAATSESSADRIMQTVTVRRSIPDLKMGTPDDRQLAAINQFRRKGMPEFRSDEVVTIPWLASHSLLQYGQGAWTKEALAQMCYLAPGSPFELNHQWEDVSEIVGWIWDAQLVSILPNQAQGMQAQLDEIMDASAGTHHESNQDLIRRNGSVYLLFMQSCHKANSPFVDAVKYGSIRACSTGCILTGDGLNYICPTCTDSRGEYVSFDDEDCPHLMPSPFLSWFVDTDNEEVRKLIAPYFLKHSVSTFIELSAVVAPGLPGARVLEG